MNALALLALLAWAPMSPVDIERAIDRGDLEEAKAGLADSELTPVAQATLEGRLALAEDDPQRAAERFAEAVRLAPEHSPLRMLWAHALLRADRPEAVEEALRPLDATEPAVALLLATAAEEREDPARAYTVLQAAAGEHPERLDLAHRVILLCAREGLLEAARAWVETLTPAQLGRTVALAVLQEIRSDVHALGLARQLAAAFPDDADIQAQLGWAASAAGATFEASRAFARAVQLGADEAYAAAEHARATGKHREALRMNARVRDDRRRALQRFDILFESGKSAQAIAAAEGLSLDARRRYNLAYAHYGLQQYAEASAQARRLAGTDYGGRAKTLLRAMGR